MCHRRDLPGQPPPSWRFTEQPQPRPGLTAAKRRQGLSQFGSLRSEKEPFCFICRFSKRVSVSQREIQVDRNPSSGTHRPLEMGLAQPAEQRMLRHSPAGHGSLPAPSQSDEDGDGSAKNLEFGPVCLDRAAQWSLPPANTVPTQTPALVLPE